MIAPLPVVEPPHARAALRLEVRQAAPAKPFLAAVEIATDPHWHVYWRNPGDSGVPTKIEWRAPKGWKVLPLEYPVPKRFAPGGVTAYGYEGRTLFLARVTPSKVPGILTAKANWLVCQEACFQGSASLAVKIPLGMRQTPGPMAKTLEIAQNGLPKPDGDWSVRAEKGSGVVLTAEPAPNVELGEKWKGAEFFPAESGAVDQSKPISATLAGRTLVFKMDASPFPEKRTRLPGLIAYEIGGRRFAISVNPKIETGKTK